MAHLFLLTTEMRNGRWTKHLITSPSVAQSNPRKNDSAVDRMCGPIREFGFKIPCLVRSAGEVIDGHLRLKAARKLGISEIPVILCDEWTPAQVKAFRLIGTKSCSLSNCRISSGSSSADTTSAPGRAYQRFAAFMLWLDHVDQIEWPKAMSRSRYRSWRDGT